MEIYIILAIILALFTYSQKGNNKEFLLLVGVLGLFVLSAWRGFSVGIDTFNYKMIYDHTSDNLSYITIRSREFFFPYLMYGLNSFGLGYRWFLVTVATIFSILVWVVCRQSERPLTVLLILWLLGYYFQFYNISRQLIAVLIVLSAFPLLKQRKFLWWIGLILVASLVHTTALFAFLLYPLSKKSITNDQIVWVAVILLISFMTPFVFNTRSLTNLLEDNYFVGNTYEMYSKSINKDMFSWNRLIMNFFFLALMVLDKEKIKNVYTIFIIAYLVFLNLFPFSGTIGRVALYFGCFQLLYFPHIGRQSSIIRAMIAAYCLAVFALFLITDNCGVIPYVFGGQ